MKEIYRSRVNRADALMRVILIGIVATALTACGLFLSEDAQLTRAQEAQKRGDLRAAAIDLKSLLEKHPNNREARFSLGLVDLDSGDAVAAAREFERLRQEGVPDTRIVEPLARAYLAQRELDTALALLDGQLAKESPKESPKNSKAVAVDAETQLRYQRLRGEVLLVKGDFAAARTAFDSVIAANPKDVRALLGLTSVIESTDGVSAALAVTDRAVAADPNDPNVQLARGALFMKNKRVTDAAAAFQEAARLATAPTKKGVLLEALGGLAQSQAFLGQVNEALNTSARMQKIAPNSPLTRYIRAYALVQHGDLDEARKLLEQNVAQAQDLRSKLLLGAVNLTQGRYAQAEMHLSSVVAAAPDNVEARRLLAQSRLRQSKPNEALDALLPAVGSDKHVSGDLLVLAGQASLAAGKTKEGVALLKRNVEQHPDELSAQLDLAGGYLAAGQADQALAVLGGAAADKSKSSANSAPDERQTVRREYLAVLARIQKGDIAGAAEYAIKVAEQQKQNSALQMLASSALTAQRQYEKARPFAESVIRLLPDQAVGYANLGRLDLLQGNANAARENFQTALKKKPDDATSATSLALIELAAQHGDEALALLSEFRKHNATSIEPRILEAQVLLSRGKIDEAEKLARENVAMASSNASALAGLARVLSVKGLHAEALDTFDRALHVQPNSVPLRFQMAVEQSVAGHVDDAIRTAREALKRDANYAPAMQLDGVLSVAKGDLSTASRYVEILTKTADDQSATHELIGVLRNAQRRFDDAAGAFHKAGELNPQPRYAIGEYQARVRGKLGSPEQPLAQFLAKHPNESTVRIMLAQAQQQRGDRAGAARSYEQVLSNQPRNPIALNNLAWMHHEDGKADAVDLARRAHEADPNTPAIADTYAWILVGAGRVNEALQLLDPIVGDVSKKGTQKETQGVAPDIRAHYAVALARAGRTAEAKALAKELTAANAPELSSEVRALIADLAKS